MKRLELRTAYSELLYEELEPSDKTLVDEARKAASRAYAPYSRFNVGAAILLDNGEIITGANQENASFPSGSCAERSACFYAHSKFPEAKFLSIAIAARDAFGSETKRPVSPCGSCRQALLEYENLFNAPVKVILAGKDCTYLLPSIRSLLPLAFDEF